MSPRPVRRTGNLAVRSARIHRGQPFTPLGRKKELRVLHAERVGDPGPDELIERRARGAFDNAAEDVGVVAVDPRLARLRREGQRGEPLHGVADGLVLVGGEPSEPGGRTEPLRLVKCGDIGAGAVRNTGRVREEIANSDGPLRGHDLHLSLVTRGNGRVGVRRNVTAHRFVDADLSFFDQRQDRRARDGFRLRRDAEDRVGRHAPAGFLVAPAERPFVDRLAISKNEREP